MLKLSGHFSSRQVKEVQWQQELLWGLRLSGTQVPPLFLLLLCLVFVFTAHDVSLASDSLHICISASQKEPGRATFPFNETF